MEGVGTVKGTAKEKKTKSDGLVKANEFVNCERSRVGCTGKVERARNIRQKRGGEGAQHMKSGEVGEKSNRKDGSEERGFRRGEGARVVGGAMVKKLKNSTQAKGSRGLTDNDINNP